MDVFSKVVTTSAFLFYFWIVAVTFILNWVSFGQRPSIVRCFLWPVLLIRLAIIGICDFGISLLWACYGKHWPQHRRAD